HHVVLEFLRSEQKTTKFPTPPDWQSVIANPNLSDPLENQKRLRLLYIPRARFMIEIPPDTTWWEVHSLTENELGELYVSAKHNTEWDGPGNQLGQVAAAIPAIPLDAPPACQCREVLAPTLGVAETSAGATDRDRASRQTRRWRNCRGARRKNRAEARTAHL